MNEATYPQPSMVTSRWQHIRAWAQPWLDRMTLREKTILALLAVILITSGALSLVGFIDRHTHLIAQFGGTYTEAAVGQPRYINPILAGANDLDLDLTSLVYSSLFKLDNEFNLTNDLASEYSISEDGKIYTVKLRHDASWHDGQPLTADDVVFTIRSIQTADYGSPLLPAFQGVQVEKTDDYTVTFTLKQPYAPFLSSLTVGIVPHHVWENIPPKNAALAEQMLKPVGTGPFKFAEIATRRKTGEITTFRLERNEGYFGQRPYIDQIIFYFYPTHEEALQALLAGKADGVGFLPLSLADRVKAKKSIILERLLLPQYFGLFFNQGKNEALTDAGVRSALNLATDREKIIQEALGGEAKPLSVPITSGFFHFDSLPTSNYDPEKAKQNLDDAGWKVSDDGIRTKNDKKLSFKISTTDWPEYVKTAEIVQQSWRDIGVDLQIEHFGAGTIQQTVVGPREYEILLYGEILPAQPDPYPFWHSTQTRAPGLNLALFKDAKSDKLLEEARQTSDINARQEKYTEFISRILDVHPAIILYQPYYLFSHDDNVRGNTMTQVNLPAGRFNDISSWHVKVKRVWGQEV
jgi:peptide/nickel transport system substrate-binding protein